MLAETIMTNQSDFDESYHAAAKALRPQRRLYPKTLTVFLDASPSGKHRAIHAAALAQRWDAHVIGVHVVFAGVRLHPPSESWAIGERAFQAVIAHEKRLREDAEAVAAHVSEHFQALCARWNVAGELRRIDSDQPAQETILKALHSDLVIVGHPEPIVTVRRADLNDRAVLDPERLHAYGWGYRAHAAWMRTARRYLKVSVLILPAAPRS